ncbi:hypothetical protein WKW79_33975 [Variovorax robiniae]|uniref:DUF3617 domain-containing protein n=1 Tax=Variovorax robiniae TaxID=1836199 RepID=A0ABU8XLR3_9BURK
MALTCLIATLCCASALAATHGNSPQKRRPNHPHNSAPHAGSVSEPDGQERFLLLSADDFFIAQTAFASAKQCQLERKRTLQRNPRLARYVAQGELDFECLADDAGPDLPYETSIIDKSTGLRADLSMRTQSECEIGMRHAKAAGRRYAILSMCQKRPWGPA